MSALLAFLLVLGVLTAVPVTAWADSEAMEDERSRRGLDHDLDVDTWLRNLDRFLRGDEYDLAAMTVQQILDRAFEQRSLVIPSEDGRFVPVADLVEQRILANARLRRAYTLAADREARSLWARTDRASEADRRAILEEIVARYFLSSEGDRAAFELGCMLLDERNFRMARRLLMQASRHPNPSLDAGMIDRRLAAVHAFLGEEQELAAALERLRRTEQAFKPAIIDQLREISDREASLATSPRVIRDRSAALGDISRRAVAMPLGGSAGQSPSWASLWTTDDFIGVAAPLWLLPNMRQFTTFEEVRNRTSQPHEITRRWRQHQWIPTSQLFFDEDTVYFRTHHFINPLRPGSKQVPALVAVKIETGELKWFIEATPPPTITAAAQVSPMMTRINHILSSRIPTSAEEQLLFDDSIAQQITLDDGVIYAVEGHEWAVGLRVPETQFGVTSQLLIGHRLISVDARTGRLRWRIAADRHSGPEATPTNFLSAPMRIGENLLVVAEIHQTIYLIALDDRPDTVTRGLGERELWRRHIVSSHQMIGRINRTVGMASDSGELFIATGRGIVTAVSSLDGRTLWTTAYRADNTSMRDSERQMMVMGGRNPPPYGFAEDTVIPVGDYVVVLPSDAAAIHLFDRTTGRLLDHRAVAGLTYAIGAADQGVILGGPGRAARYDVGGGRIRQIWTRAINGKSARGAITGDAIYIPSDVTIFQLDPKDGLTLNDMPIAESHAGPNGGFPVGNLFASDDGMLVYQPGRISRLVETDRQLQVLKRSILERPDREKEVRLQMADLLTVAGRPVQAIEQLGRLLPDDVEDAAGTAVVDRLFDLLLQQADQHPAKARRWLDEAATLPIDEARRMQLGLVQARLLESLGEIEAAVDHLLPIGRQPARSLLADFGDNVENRVQAVVLARRHLSELLLKNPLTIERVVEAARAWSSEIGEDADVADWVAWVRTVGRTPIGPELTSKLVDRLVAENRIEEAERILLEMFDSESEHAISYGVLVAEFYTSMRWETAAARQWRWIRDEIDARTMDGVAPAQAERLAQRAREALASLSKPLAEDRKPQPGDYEYRQSWVHEVPATVILDTHGRHASDHLEGLVVMASPRSSEPFIHGRQTDGSSAWRVRLSDRIEGADGPAPMQNRRGIIHMHEMVLTHADASLLRDGHIGFAVGTDHLIAYGLVNCAADQGGEVEPLWRVPLGGSWMHHVHQFPGWTPAQGRHDLDTAVAGEGIFALLVRDARTNRVVLRAFDTLNGHVVWERYVPFWQPIAVGYGQGCIWVLGEGNVVSVLERTDGRVVAQVELDDLSPRMKLILHDEGLLYGNADDGITLLDIENGSIRWSARGYRGGTWLLNSDQNVVLSLSQFQRALDYEMIDVRTGAIVRRLERSVMGPLVRGYLHGDVNAEGRMVLVGHNRDFNLFVGLWSDADADEMVPINSVQAPHFIQGMEGAVRSIMNAGPLIPQAKAVEDGNVFVVRMVSKSDAKPIGPELVGPEEGRFRSVMLVFSRRDGAVIQCRGGIYAFAPKDEDSIDD
ncbi:MAG: PQQ-binding-like beta-propeller repeat protein [Phycisphaeraceae bacterium]|nr:PQQ-binding-like beta-propeller repeat protein [Phycisphaeraceae bacterium]